MDLVCKLCNGMTEIHQKCSFCGSEMKDGGAISNYYGPYSPYEKIELMPGVRVTTGEGEQCIHLLVCPVCGADMRVGIDLMQM
ncbi:hypothetical protein [Desulfolucanica intricata]|uniref:hypothetical protein n=1 Tax=Desulfolucanica intricata TaxID=1285191 RepID=UPI00082E7491|nr:hypothetical protein [Desulfolucanica intricata]